MGNLAKRSCGFIVCLLSVLLCIGLYSSTALAIEVHSGYIGDSALTWELTDGILTIGGSGEAPIFASPEDQPWAEVRDQIIEVWYPNPGDISVPDMQYWFTACVNLTRAEIPYMAQVIGTDAFANCPSLTEVLFYYYDSDNFEIIEGAFFTAEYVDTKIYVVSEQADVFQRIKEYSWYENNRHVSFYDVYSQTALAETIIGFDCFYCNGEIVADDGGDIYCESCWSSYEYHNDRWVCYWCGYENACHYVFDDSYHEQNVQVSCGCVEVIDDRGPHFDDDSDGYCDVCSFDMSNVPSTVTITWNNSDATSTTTLTIGSLLTLPVTPTKIGYTFKGWYTASSGGTQVTASTPVPSSNTTYYAQWTPVTTTLWINPMGGFWNGSDAVVNFPSTYGSTMYIPIPTAVGHTFTGWSFASLVGSEWTGAPVGTMTSLTGDSIYTYAGTTDGAHDALFANWRIHISSFNVNPNGGVWNGITTAVKYVKSYGETIIVEEPTREGYTFTRWILAHYTGTEWTYDLCNGSISGTSGLVTYTYGPIDGVDDGVIAEWVPNTYSVLWVVDGTTFDTTSQVYDTSITLPVVEPIKEYHHFDGWWTDPVGGVRVTEDMLYQTASDVTYYAHFTQVFSVTVPLSVPVLVSETGEVYVPELCVVNDSTGRVAIVDVLVESLNGWTLVPYSTRMEYEKVNSNLVGVRLNEWVSSVFGVYEEFTPNWVIAENSFFILEPDFVISPMKYGCSDLVILRMVFTVRWS